MRHRGPKLCLVVESVRPHTTKSRFSNVPVPADGAGALPIAGSALPAVTRRFPRGPHVPGVAAAVCAARNYALRDLEAAERAVIFRGANRTNGIGTFSNRKRTDRGDEGSPVGSNIHDCRGPAETAKRKSVNAEINRQTVARLRSVPSGSETSSPIDRGAAHHGAHDLDVLNLLLVHRVRIVCQNDEIRQFAWRDGSLDRFLM